MAILVRLAITGILLVFLVACASTSTDTNDRAVASVPQSAPPLEQLTNDRMGAYFIQGRTRLEDIQRWWGRPQAQGLSGDVAWYNYTWVGAAQSGPRNAGDTKMVTLTVYFMADTGLLADYDLQVHEFPAHSQNR